MPDAYSGALRKLSRLSTSRRLAAPLDASSRVIRATSSAPYPAAIIKVAFPANPDHHCIDPRAADDDERPDQIEDWDKPAQHSILVATGLETWREVKAITLFHLLGQALELFKTHPAIAPLR